MGNVYRRVARNQFHFHTARNTYEMSLHLRVCVISNFTLPTDIAYKMTRINEKLFNRVRNAAHFCTQQTHKKHHSLRRDAAAKLPIYE